MPALDVEAPSMPTRRQFTAVTATLAMATSVLGTTALGTRRAAAQPTGLTVRDIGEIPNYTIASYGSHIGELAGVGPRIWMTIDGSPVTVAQVDPATGEVDWQMPLPASDGGSWAVAATSDGTVYVGTWPNGVLYRKTADETEFTAIGRPRPDTTWIWSVSVDEDGTVYGDSYSTADGEGRVFSWTPGDGFRDYGVAVAGVPYVRALAHGRDEIYAGTGPEGHLVAIDKRTGTSRDLGWPAGVDRGFVQRVRVVGSKVYAHLPGGTHVYDLARRLWLDSVGHGFGRGISDAGPRGEVHVDGDDSIVAIDPRGNARTVATNPQGGYLLGMGWVELEGQPRLVATNKYGKVLIHHPDSDEIETLTPAILGDQIPPHALETGPDGSIYTGGYMIGGLASYDPATDTFGETQGPIAQIEGMATVGDLLYLGTYTGAVVYAHDPTQPWENGRNPQEILNLASEDQDRPFAVTGIDGVVAVGTVPDYGVLGGTLSLHDPATGDSRTWRNVVTDQSVVSLVAIDGVLYGGTSVYGGLGTAPTQDDGMVFAFDPTTGKKLWQAVPVPGERAVTGLTTGPDGMLWGMAGGSAFRMDLATRATTVAATIVTVDWPSLDHYWADGHLDHNPVTGRMNGAVRGIVFDLHPDTGEWSTIATGTDWFLQHDSGTIYWTKAGHLIEATP